MLPRVLSWSIDNLPMAALPVENDPPSPSNQLLIAPQLRMVWGAPQVSLGTGTGTSLLLGRSGTDNHGYQN